VPNRLALAVVRSSFGWGCCSQPGCDKLGRQRRRGRKRGGGRKSGRSGNAKLPQSVSAGIQSGLQGIESESASQRATSCATIAHLFAANASNTSLDEASLQQLYSVRVRWCVESGTLTKLAKLIADPSRKVRQHATGAIRNIALEGGSRICDPLVSVGAVQSLLGSISDLHTGLQVTEEREVSLYIEVLEEQLLLLAELFRHSETGAEIATTYPRISEIFLQCLIPTKSSVGIMALAVEAVHSLVDNNERLAAHIRANEVLLQLLAKIASSAEAISPKFFKNDQNRADKFAITDKSQSPDSQGEASAQQSDATAAASAAAVAAAAGGAAPSHPTGPKVPPTPAKFPQLDWFSMRLRCCDLLVECLGHSSQQPENWTRAETMLKGGLVLTTQALSLLDLRKIVTPSVTEARSVRPVGCIDDMQLAQRLFETLANWCTDTSGADPDDAASPAARRFRIVAQARFLPLLIEKLQQLKGGAEWAQISEPNLSVARNIRYRVLCCIQNLALNMPPSALGAPQHLQTLWAHSLVLLVAAGAEPQRFQGGGAAKPASASDAAEEVERLDVAVSAMLIALLARPELDDDFEVSSADLGVVVKHLCSSSSSEARMNGASILGAMCAFLEDPSSLSTIGQCLLHLCDDSSMLVVSEALNAMYDGLSDESCVGVRQSLMIAPKLKALAPKLLGRAGHLEGLTLSEDQVERVEDIVSNLENFIAHISPE